MQFKGNEALIVVHFGELWLKGNNRNDYIKRLERNIKEQLTGENFTLERYFDRLILRINKKSDVKSIFEKLKKVFGVSRVELAITTKPELNSIVSVSKKMLAKKQGVKRLKINSHRTDKQLPFNSIEIINSLKAVAEKLKIDSTTKGYDTQLNVNVTRDAAFLSFDNEKGAGGLPVGTSGKTVILLSGGIDSPVAAWYAMKRGLEPVYVHLHAFQSNEEAHKGKVSTIIAKLSEFYPHHKAYFVPSHIFQASSFKFGRYELILLKVFMLKLAEKIAKQEGAETIFTGESLGQVASQTPSNLLAEQHGISLPILRPLIGLDKEEIVQLAKNIGTFNESIKPYKDVCSINARNPKIRANVEDVVKLSKKAEMAKIVRRSISGSEVFIK